MQQIADWLEKLGLGQYAQRFAENDISFAVSPDLTDQDLKEIRLSLGHRRQLLREIANLGSARGHCAVEEKWHVDGTKAQSSRLPTGAQGKLTPLSIVCAKGARGVEEIMRGLRYPAL
jgi:hypothetical protein